MNPNRYSVGRKKFLNSVFVIDIKEISTITAAGSDLSREQCCDYRYELDEKRRNSYRKAY